MAVLGCGAVESLPAEISRKIRDINDLYFVAYHPEGPCAFMASKHRITLHFRSRAVLIYPTTVHDIPDPSKPETWKWMYSLTWPDKDSSTPAGPEAIRQNWVVRAEKLAEPLRSAYLAIASTATIWCDRLAEWPTEPWDNRNGRVTLVGDAAHPMTYREYPISPRPLASSIRLHTDSREM